MKIKILISAVLALCLTLSVQPQSFVQTANDITKITINDLYGNLTIEGTNSGKIEIIPQGTKSIPVDADMVKPYMYKNDNTGLGLNFENSDGTVRLTAANVKAQFTHYSIKVPSGCMLDIKTESMDEKIEITDTRNKEVFNTISISNISAEVDISIFAGDVIMKNVTGPIVSGVFAGSYSIDFSNLNQKNPSYITLFAGNINVILPSDTKSDLTLGAEAGKIFTDFTIANPKITPHKISTNAPVDTKQQRLVTLTPEQKNAGKEIEGAKIEGEINGGGTQLVISTFAGTVNLKKKQD